MLHSLKIYQASYISIYPGFHGSAVLERFDEKVTLYFRCEIAIVICNVNSETRFYKNGFWMLILSTNRHRFRSQFKCLNIILTYNSKIS